jgi:hypothetical protein
VLRHVRPAGSKRRCQAARRERAGVLSLESRLEGVSCPIGLSSSRSDRFAGHIGQLSATQAGAFFTVISSSDFRPV